ncbi:hypothetical protein [Oligoflexus tunisiensis]|nr:hypothetical protein [Oligoflexus tunisiensis]
MSELKAPEPAEPIPIKAIPLPDGEVMEIFASGVIEVGIDRVKKN